MQAPVPAGTSTETRTVDVSAVADQLMMTSLDGTKSGWTDQQAREYEHLIQLQMDQHHNDASSIASSNFGSIPLQPGEAIEDPFDRPPSAPPPPGFGGANSEERNRIAQDSIFSPLKHAGMEDDVRSAITGITGDSDSTERRMFSFSNLAEVLGSGLAESMEDASGLNHTNADALLRQRLSENPNWQRQTRHAASRLIGMPSTEGHPSTVTATSNGGTSGFEDNYHQGNIFAGIPSSEQPVPDGVVRGFPSSLSSPNRRNDDSLAERQETVRRSTTPVQMYPGQSGDARRSYPVPKELGMHVDEPTDEDPMNSRVASGIVSQRMDKPNFESSDFFRGPGSDGLVKSTLSSQSKEFRPAGAPLSSSEAGGNNGSNDDGGSSMSAIQCEKELEPFLWEVGRGHPSRTIAILHASWLRAPEVRQACEAFGVLESFRAEFANKGIFFASFYDIRSAQYASAEMQSTLQRLVLLNGSSEDVLVRYCLPLNSSSQFDESQIVITGLGDEVDEGTLSAMLKSYGAIRSVISQGPGIYAIEFQNVQDAKQALLELDSSQPWGPGVTVEVSLRSPIDRRRGRELLSAISRWRHGTSGRPAKPTAAPASANNDSSRFSSSQFPGSMNDFRRTPNSGGPMHSQHDSYGFGGYHGSHMEATTQFIMGPDGRYTQVIVQNPVSLPGHGQYGMDPRHHQQIIHGPNGQIFISSVPNPHQNMFGMQGPHSGFPPTVVTGNSFMDPSRRAGVTPYYNHSVVSDNISVHSGRSHGTHGTHMSHHSAHEEKDNRHLLLDLDAVENGRDTRTSLMVRNIPNKYTQQMLLSEFTENGHGPGVIDFFYLPIDFKNRCNRGYAFINFVDYKDILAFHQRYYGKHWRTFNSDKICDITYARIQGKAAMLKRFENSALMEKDDEYKPLVFGSEGPEKGKRLAFPEPANKTV